MTSSFIPANSEGVAPAGGIDTIVLSGASYSTNEAADSVSPPGDDIVSAASSPWGEGEGLNGEILRPKNIESLIEIFEGIEFDATIYSDNYLRYANLDASVNAYDQDGDYLFSRNIHGYANNEPSYSAGISEDGEITYSAGTTDIDFRENLHTWEQKEIIKNIGNIIDHSLPTNSGTSFDDSSTEEDTTYLFIRPESIRTEGLIRSNSANPTINNPEFRDFESLSTSAPLTIEINNSLVTEIRDAIDASKIEITQSDIIGVKTDYGTSPNITIKLSEYQDTYGKIDFAALNADQRLILELNSDAGNKLTRIDNANAYVNLRTEAPGVNSHLSLNAQNHDQEEQIFSGAAIGYIEDGGEDITTFELGFSEWSFDNFTPDSTLTSITYDIYNLSTNFETLGGNTHTHLNEDQFSMLEGNSIQSITFDLTDWNRDSYSDPVNPEFSAALLLSNLDLAAAHDIESVLELDHSFDYAHFNANYDFYLNNDPNINVGRFYINGSRDNDGYTSQNVNGNLWQEIADFSQVESKLSSLRFYGNPVGNNESGDIALNFGYDSDNDSYNLNSITGWGWGEEYRSDDGTGILPSTLQFNWEQFAALEISNIESGISDPYAPFEISTYLDERDFDSLELSYNLYRLSDYLVDEAANGINPLNQLAVLGDSVDNNSRFVLDINAESLEDDWNIESTDITIQFDPNLFGAINASDIKIGGALPLANAVQIDNENGTIRLAAASLSNLNKGTGIYGEEDFALASISLDFAEENIKLVDKNSDGSLKINPLSFDISVNEDEAVFSNEYIDDDGLLNREIVSLGELGGHASVIGQDVTLYEAKINLEQQGDGLVLGTERVIGSDASYTNLVRKGDTLTTEATWLNVGNIEANNLTHIGMWNENARLVNGFFSRTSLASGSFIDGVFVEDAREATTFTTDIEITGEAGNVVDLADGIVAIQAAGTSEVFNNQGQGSSNLITFQGDLNYDGRVSMKDLAYLNAGAARQKNVSQGSEGDLDANGILDASVARDVDADFNGSIDLADLAVLDADWGKTLHTGDEQFQGSNDISWSELDNQGESTSWDNDSFKDQNDTESDSDYVGSLESPTSNAIGADNNQSSGDGGIDGEAFQDPLAA